MSRCLRKSSLVWLIAMGARLAMLVIEADILAIRFATADEMYAW